MSYIGQGSIKRECIICGEPVYRQPSQVDKTKYSVCSSKCRGKANARKIQKITIEQARQAHEKYINGEKSISELAKELGISYSALRKRFGKLNQ